MSAESQRGVTLSGRRWVALVVLVVLLAACGARGPEPPPSETDARVHLERLVMAAQARDWDTLCAHGSATCRDHLDADAVARVPPAPPRITGWRVMGPADLDGGWTHGGLVLSLCGIDGLGETYHSEVLVFRDGAALRAIGEVYWIGIRIPDSDTVGGEQPAPDGECR